MTFLDQLERLAQGGGEPFGRLAPTVRQVDDPRADLEAIVELYDDEALPTRRRSRVMQRQRQQRRGDVDTTPAGVTEYNGRPCCVETIAGLQGRAHLLAMPYSFACETCGASFVVELQHRGGL